jgi:hypothetical protein
MSSDDEVREVGTRSKESRGKGRRQLCGGSGKRISYHKIKKRNVGMYLYTLG